MFHDLTLRGVNGRLLLGVYGDAARLRTWAVARKDQQWTLTGVIERVDLFQIRQRPLSFTAPREKLRGFWLFPVQPTSVQIQGAHLVARLGPPQHGG